MIVYIYWKKTKLNVFMFFGGKFFVFFEMKVYELQLTIKRWITAWDTRKSQRKLK